MEGRKWTMGRRGRGGRRGGLTVLVVVVAIFLSVIISSAYASSFPSSNRRQDTINEWIRTIKRGPQAHSLSPSWNGKSPYRVIGVSNLPLQNEVSEEEGEQIESGNSRSYVSRSPPRSRSYTYEEARKYFFLVVP